MTARLGIEVAYLAASVLFILGLKALSSPRSARRGMFMAELGMLIAVAGTLLNESIITYEWIVVGLVVGSAAGAMIAVWTPMTAMPQRTALSHAFGALAAALVGVSEYAVHGGHLSLLKSSALGFEVLLGAITFTGSLMAFAKLQGWLPGSPITFKGQNLFNLTLLVGLLGCLAMTIVHPSQAAVFYTMVGLACAFGVLLVIPIGAADMPWWWLCSTPMRVWPELPRALLWATTSSSSPVPWMALRASSCRCSCARP